MNMTVNKSAFSLKSLLAGVAAMVLLPVAHAAQPATVTFIPQTTPVEGPMPLVTSYQLNITSPSNFPKTGASSTVSVNVTDNFTPQGGGSTVPLGVDPATAMGFVSIVPSTVTFNGPNQTAQVNVIVNVQPGFVAGEYAYQITTAGWPAAVQAGLIPSAAFINLSVQPQVMGAGVAPVVNISAPPTGANTTISLGDTAQIPFAFAAYTPDGSPITSVNGDVDGSLLVLGNFSGNTSNVQLGNITGLGTANVTGTALVTVTPAAQTTYTFHAYAENAVGSDTDSSQFTVYVNQPPPVISIQDPANGTVVVHNVTDPLPVIPFDFTVSSQSTVTISSISATLQGTLTNPVGLLGSLLGTLSGFAANITGTVLGAIPVNLTNFNVGSLQATGSANLQLPAGTYTLTAYGTDATGVLVSDTTTFTVVDQGVVNQTPPTVTITSPSAGTSYTLPASGPLLVPFSFTGHSNAGNITALSATLNGQALTYTTSPATLGTTANATGSTTLSINAAGNYTINVTAKDAVGTANATTSFIVNVSNPALTLAITSPTNNAVYTHTTGTPNLSIPFVFVANANSGSTVASITGTLNGANISVTSTNLNTAAATGTGSLSLAAGNYTLVSTATSSANLTTTKSVSFSIVESVAPPTVVINTPSPNSTYTYSGSTVSVPLTFTGASKAPKGLTALSATLNGKGLSVSTSGLGKASGSGSASLKLNATGTYTIVVTATDAVGTATATETISVVAPPPPPPPPPPVPCIAISSPTNGATFYLVQGSNLTIPYSVTASIAKGATIANLTTKLGSSSVTLATSGLNTAVANGTASLSISATGNYTLTATTVSNYGTTATTSVTITVKASSNIPCKADWSGCSWLNSCQRGGSYVPVCFQLDTSCFPYWMVGNNDDNQWNSWGGNTWGCNDGRSYTRTYNNGAGVVCDPSVSISVCEVYADGSCSSPTVYSCPTNSWWSYGNTYSVDGNDNYSFYCPTRSGTHTYQVQVNCTPQGSNTPQCIAQKTFCTQ